MDGKYQIVNEIESIAKEIREKTKQLNSLHYIDTSFLKHEIQSLSKKKEELIDNLKKLDVKNRR